VQLGVFYWDDSIPLAAVLEEAGSLEAGAYLAAWKALGGEAAQRLNVTIADAESAKSKLAAASVFVLAHRPVGGGLAQGGALPAAPPADGRLAQGAGAGPTPPRPRSRCCRCPAAASRRCTSPARRAAWRSC
jgi:hypothetical protein